MTNDARELSARLALPPATSNAPANSRVTCGDPSVQLADLTRANSPASEVAMLSHQATRDEARPLSADLSRLHITVTRAFLEKLEAARDALSHARPDATIADVLEAGLDQVLAKHAKSKGIVSNPRREPSPSGTKRIPAHVKRAVWERDGGRCQWPIESGGVCGSTKRVEFAHREPRARGGPATVENLRLLCAVHNQHEARLQLGESFMEQFKGGGARRAFGGSAAAVP